jgi:argininosuccinate lyase
LPDYVELEDDALARVLSPRHFVEVRKTPGGPAPEEMARAIEASRERLTGDGGWLQSRIDGLRSAERELADAIQRLRSAD